jgi:ATP:ADP antiporter, AAA family
MRKLFFSLLNVEKGEERPVVLLLVYGFFMGIFFSVYQPVCETLFLSRMPEYLTEAMFASGLAGVLSTGAFAWLQRRLKYAHLVNINIVLVFSFIVMLRLMIEYTQNDWLIFLLYIMFKPIFAICMLSFWGIFGRIFDLRQSKRIIGGIDAGQLIATILGLFSVPFLQSYFKDQLSLLSIGEAGLVFALITLVVINKQVHLGSYHVGRGQEVPKETRLFNIFKNRYIVLLSSFLFFSMLAYSFLMFSFQKVTSLQYTDEAKLMTFLSMTHGSILFVSLIMQTFVNEKLISMYGLRTCLKLLPVVLSIFIGFSLIAGFSFGYTPESPDFIYFFLFITLSYLLGSILRDALENPVFKIFFMPLDPRFRFDIQTRVEGMVNEIARLVSGTLIFIFGLITIFRLIDYTLVLYLILIPYFALIFTIYKYYRDSIKKRLEEQKHEFEEQQQHHDLSQIKKQALQINNKERLHHLIFLLKVLARYSPEQFKLLVDTIRSQRKNLYGHMALSCLEDDVSFVHLTGSLYGREPIEKSHESKQELDLSSFLKSARPEDRRFLAEMIGLGMDEESSVFLNELLSDSDPQVIKSAIAATGNCEKLDLLPVILDFLHQQDFMDYAADALVNFGEKCFPNLESVFFGREDNYKIKLKIIGIYGRIGGLKAIELLWDKIDYPDFNVGYKVIQELSRCGMVANESQRSKFKTFIEEDIQVYLYNLMAIQLLASQKDHAFKLLIQAIREDNQQKVYHVFTLLEIIFDRESILLAKENIEKGTGEGLNNALELLDIILSEDLQHKVICFLDDISDEQKIDKLIQFYPIEKEESIADVLMHIINRDLNKSNRFTRACAINCIPNIDYGDFNFDDILMANLFNPDSFIFEVSWKTAAQVNANINNVFCQRNNIRDVDKLFEEKFITTYRHHLVIYSRFELISFFKEKTLLSDLHGYFLANIVENMQVKTVDREQIEPLSEFPKNQFLWVYKGEVCILKDNEVIVENFAQGDLIGEQLNAHNLTGTYTVKISADTILLAIDHIKFYELITDDLNILLKVSSALGLYKRPEAVSDAQLIED